MPKTMTPQTSTSSASDTNGLRFQSLFDHMLEGVVIYQAVDDGRDFVFVDINKAGQAISQVSKSQVIGCKLTEIFPGVQEIGLLDAFRQVWTTGQSVRLPVRQYQDQRLSQWIDNSIFKLPSGEIVAVYSDETDHQQADEELRKEENLLKAIINTIPVMITLYDPDVKMLYLNTAFEETIGWTTEEVQDIDLLEQVYPDKDYRKQVLAYMQQASTEWKEFRVQSKSGEIIDSEWSNVQLENGTQIGIGIDVRQRRKMEKGLRESKDLLDATGRMARVGGWELDAGTLEVGWTEETYRIHELPFGYKPPLQEAIDFFHPEDRERLSDAIQKALQEGKPYDLELRFITAKGNQLWTRTICRPEVAEGKTVKLRGTFQDITDLKQAQEQIQELNRGLEQRVQERTRELKTANSELESFVYSVSHDLRAPLRAISGFAEIITERHKDQLNEQGQHYFENIVEASEQMGHLIEDLLTYSRLGRKALAKKSVDLFALFSEIQQNFADKIEASQARIDLPEDFPVLRSDRSLLYVILSNIFENALNYHQPGTKPVITVFWHREHQNIRLSLQDKGIGIAPEYHEKIFDIFQRLQPQSHYPGTGIGLGLVKKAAGLLGGRVSVESQPGAGSIFHVELPNCLE